MQGSSGWAAFVLAACIMVWGGAMPALAQSADASLSCPQLLDQVNQQNAIIKAKSDDKAQLQSARPDPGAADPEIQERMDDIAANKATTRANALLAVGRQKKCFK